jgi:hypothetical protein
MLLYQHADLKQAKALVNLEHKVVVVVVVVVTSWLFSRSFEFNCRILDIDNLCTEPGFYTTLL